MKRLIGLAAVVVIIVYGVKNFSKQTPVPTTSVDGYKNATYVIDGKTITLVNGMSEIEATPSSASKIETKYFGNEVRADLNADGMQDIAFLVTQSGSGSGTFYYIVAALKTATGYTGTNAILLGDRIAPQTTEFRDKEIIVNYADRKPNEPMTTTPTIAVSRYFTLLGATLAEVSVGLE